MPMAGGEPEDEQQTKEAKTTEEEMAEEEEEPLWLKKMFKLVGLDSDDEGPNLEEEEQQQLMMESDSEDDEEEDKLLRLQRRRRVRQEEELLDKEEEGPDDFSPEANLRDFSKVLDGSIVRRRQDREDRNCEFYEDLFDFPRDPEKWMEEDLKEYWADAPGDSTKIGWDPVWADEDDWEDVISDLHDPEAEEMGVPPPAYAPFYVPYYKCFPVIPDNHFDIKTPKDVIEELDRIEEFLKWVSYTFQNGSTYEGTVWDDLAHGKGVYVSKQELVRYEGEWLQNLMDGHGVVEVDIPEIQPIPGSKLEEKMRAEGKIIKADYMTPRDREWLKMDIEDSVIISRGRKHIPFYERDEWLDVFGDKPEIGRYKYAGQWKHGRMHGCGVYEVNERVLYGRFYFGDYVEDSVDCDVDVSAAHAGIAEVAAAKARMFVNKPDGMVREYYGPFSDPQHPYFYEEEDAWMAPGFINQFYEVPDYWKTYVQDVDQEREMWLNSFYKAPLRIPMPAELEYWWENDEDPEFVLINKEPEPDPEDPSKLIYTEDPLILHTPTGRLINYVDDEEHGIRLFWQPPLEEGEDVDPEKVEFLPLGFDEYYGKTKPVQKKQSWLVNLLTAVEKNVRPTIDRLEKWTEEKKKESELKRKLSKHRLELAETELCLEEELQELDFLLKKKKEEEEKAAGQQDTDQYATTEDRNVVEPEEGEEEEEEEEAPSSFGTVSGQDANEKDRSKKDQSKRSPFSSLSLSFGSSPMAFAVPGKLHDSFVSWTRGRKSPITAKVCPVLGSKESFQFEDTTVGSIRYHRSLGPRARLRVAQQKCQNYSKNNNSRSRLNGLAQILSSHGGCRASNTTCPPEGVSPLNDSQQRPTRMLDVTDYPLNMMSIHVATGVS